MDTGVEERINAISENVTQISISVAKLWEARVDGQPPHKTTLNMMIAILAVSALSVIIGVFVAIEMYLLLYKVHAIYSLML